MDVSARTPDLTAIRDLPEMTRDAIERGLSDVRLPDRPTLEQLGRAMPDVDVPKALTGAATAVGLIRPSRPRWPFVLLGALALAAVSWVAMNRAAVRARLDQTVQAVREGMPQMDGAASDEPVAFTAAETAPIQADGPTGSNGNGSDYPAGLGEDGTTAHKAEVELTR